MKVVYVAHQLSAPTAEGMRQNRLKASLWCAWIATTFRVATVADWIILSSHLPETPENRAFVLECDKALIERCGLVWMVGPSVSGGMTIESQHGREHDVPAYDLTGLPMDKDIIEAALAEQGCCPKCLLSEERCRSWRFVQSKCCPFCVHGERA